MIFVTEVESEVVRYVVSKKSERTLVNPPDKVWRDTTHFKTLASHFYIGKSIIYTNEEG